MPGAKSDAGSIRSLLLMGNCNLLWVQRVKRTGRAVWAFLNLTTDNERKKINKKANNNNKG